MQIFGKMSGNVQQDSPTSLIRGFLRNSEEKRQDLRQMLKEFIKTSASLRQNLRNVAKKREIVYNVGSVMKYLCRDLKMLENERLAISVTSIY